MPAFSASDIAASTNDAYSFHVYGPKQWTACALLLACRGYNEPETRAILYSSVMRLAADGRAGRTTTSSDLLRLLDASGTAEYLRENLDEYVLNIIGEDLTTDDTPQLESRVALRLVWSAPK